MLPSACAGKQCRDSEFPEGVRIGVIKQVEQSIKRNGGTRVNEGDSIALFALSQDVGQVESLLQVSIDYF